MALSERTRNFLAQAVKDPASLAELRTILNKADALSTQAALTAADGGTVDGTYGSDEADVISNNVTRIGQIEAALIAVGILASP